MWRSKLAGTAATLLLLGGCGAGWKHTANTQAPLAQDRHACEERASAQFPVMMAPSGPMRVIPGQTRCERQGHITNCTTLPAQFYPAPMHDLNRGYRSQSLHSCMQARGYEWRWSE